MFKIAFRNLMNKKLRTGLAMLGLVLGVITIVTLISVTVGIQASFNELLSGIEGIIVLEEDSVDNSLSKLPLSVGDEIEQIVGVKAALPELFAVINEIDGKAPEGGGASFGLVFAFGVDPVKERFRGGKVYGVSLEKGRYLIPGDTRSVVLGNQVAENHDKFVGSTIELEDKKFKVVGIIEPSQISDATIVMPIDEARAFGNFEIGEVSDFFVILNNIDDDERIANQIEARIDDVDAGTTAEFGEQLSAITSVLDSFLLLLSTVAIAIGSIGIINTMLMSVRERIREFGVLRATGWTSEDVLRLIVTESLLLGIGSAVIGTTTGVILVEWLKGVIGFPLAISVEVVFIAALFTIVLSILAGVYPAWRASAVDPIKALRGEL